MTTTLADPPILTPTHDPAPVQQAAIDGITCQHPPETFLWIIFHKPDGGARVRYAWTPGGTQLGDHIDARALAAGLDAADWLAITGRHRNDSTRGRIEIQAHPLRPILADVRTGRGADAQLRDKVARMVTCAADMTGQTPTTTAPRWLGVGPSLLNTKARA